MAGSFTWVAMVMPSHGPHSTGPSTGFAGSGSGRRHGHCGFGRGSGFGGGLGLSGYCGPKKKMPSYWMSPNVLTGQTPMNSVGLWAICGLIT